MISLQYSSWKLEIAFARARAEGSASSLTTELTKLTFNDDRPA